MPFLLRPFYIGADISSGMTMRDPTSTGSKMAGVIVYSISGVLLTLVNKIAIRLFPYACLLIIVQNFMTVVLLIAGSALFKDTLGTLPCLTWALVRRWVPLSVLFVAMLVSSLLALKDVSPVTLVVLRNLTTLVVAIGEWRFLGARFSSQALATLLGMLFGAVIYGASDLSFHARGYAWVGFNILASSLYQIYVKMLAKDSALTPLGMSYINNMVSIPILALCSFGLREPTGLVAAVAETGPLDVWTVLVVAITGLLGYALSTSAFLLNKLISATSIMVINNANKFGVILLSEMFMERALGPLSTAGTVLVLVYAYLYSRFIRQSLPQQHEEDKAHQEGEQGGKQGDRPLRSNPQSRFWSLKAHFEGSGPGQSVFMTVIISGLLMAYAIASSSIIGLGVAPYSVSTGIASFLVNRTGITQGLHPYEGFLPRVTEPAKECPPGVKIHAPEPTYFEPDAEFGHCAAIKTKSAHFQTCDEKCEEVDPIEIVYSYPRQTTKGESTINAIDRVLRYAWGPRPPKIDLYLRTGCSGAQELHHLLPSITLFWPRFLGKVIIVLDYADQAFAKQFVPKDSQHAYEIHFEHTPCMAGRVFNQVSYLMADKHSDADYLVTIDSDCVFHSPVTPDLLFSHDGKLRLPRSTNFQEGTWFAMVDLFLGEGTSRFHTMVSQPVSFHRSTFKAYRDWYEAEKGICYVDSVNALVNSSLDVFPFCWMCQLGTFLAVTGDTLPFYDMVDLDSADNPPYQRLAIHATYENNNLPYGNASNQIVREGLCRAVSAHVLSECRHQDTSFVDRMTFHYAGWDFNSTMQDKTKTIGGYLRRLRKAFGHIGYEVYDDSGNDGFNEHK
jgi:GDP-mannose transporter